MTNGEPLIISDFSRVPGFNFLFAFGLKPADRNRVIVDIDTLRRICRNPATGEPYYLTSDIQYPDFGNRLLKWPSISRKSETEGVFNIYPLYLKDEEEEADIFADHVGAVYTRYRDHEKGKRAVFDFLEFQYKNNSMGPDWRGVEPYQFIDQVRETLFGRGSRLIPSRRDIVGVRLYNLVWEWINKSRSELKELGLQPTMPLDVEFRDEVATPAPTPTVAPARDAAKARRAITRLETIVDDVCVKNSGRRINPNVKSISGEVLQNWANDAEKYGFGKTEKSIRRYLKDISDDQTAKKFIGQRVRQYFNSN